VNKSLEKDKVVAEGVLLHDDPTLDFPLGSRQWLQSKHRKHDNKEPPRHHWIHDIDGQFMVLMDLEFSNVDPFVEVRLQSLGGDFALFAFHRFHLSDEVTENVFGTAADAVKLAEDLSGASHGTLIFSMEDMYG